jgi:hypothetical protein
MVEVCGSRWSCRKKLNPGGTGASKQIADTLRLEAQMNRFGRPSVLFAVVLAIASVSSGCIVERQYVREVPVAPAPPPAPAAPARADSGHQQQQQQPAQQQSGSANQSDSWATSEGSSAPTPGPGVELDENYFYDRLAPYGTWQWTPEYGRVWVPSGVSSDWRPYSDGSWTYTDWGWTYTSDVPWAWAGYHYGSWGWGVGLGWFWLPGTVWGPGWVNWRWGGGFVAWAPIGPWGFWWGVNSGAWVAVSTQHFTQPISSHAVAVNRTAAVVARTTPQAGAVHPHQVSAGGRVAGPPVASISRATGQTIHAAPVNKVLPHGGMTAQASRMGQINRMSSSFSRMSSGFNSANRAADRWDNVTRAGGNRWGFPSGRPSGLGTGFNGTRSGMPMGAPHGGMAPHAGPAGGHPSGGHVGGGAHVGGGHSSGGHGGGHGR